MHSTVFLNNIPTNELTLDVQMQVIICKTIFRLSNAYKKTKTKHFVQKNA